MPVTTRSRARIGAVEAVPPLATSSSNSTASAPSMPMAWGGDNTSQVEEPEVVVLPTATSTVTVGRGRRAAARSGTSRSANRTQSQRGRRKENLSTSDGTRADRKRSASGTRKGKGLKTAENDAEAEMEPEKPAEEKKCCICLDEPSGSELATVNGCPHLFCFSCIEKWAERENSCPLCKNRFTKIERVIKCANKKRRKGDTTRVKNTKRVNHRDQRSDFVSTNPLQGLFASMEATNGSMARPIAELIFSGISGRHGRLVSLATTNPSNSSRPSRSGSRPRVAVVSADELGTRESRSISRRVTDEERQYIEQFEQWLAPHGSIRNLVGVGPNARLQRFHLSIGDTPSVHTASTSASENENSDEDVGNFVRRVRAVIDGLSDASNRAFGGSVEINENPFGPQASNSGITGGDTAENAIEIDDSESEESS